MTQIQRACRNPAWPKLTTRAERRRGLACFGPGSVLTVASLVLPGCQALVDVDDYTFQATPLTNGGATGAADAGGAGAGGRGGAGTSTGAAGADAGAPSAQPGAAGALAGPQTGPIVEPTLPADSAELAEPPPLAPGVAALESLPRPAPGFLRPPEVLVVGSPLRSRNGYVELRLELNGLVVTHQQVDGARAVVATLPLTNAHVATLADDGHFVVFSRDGSITDLSSNAGLVPGPTLRVQNDGNVVLYDNDAVLPRTPRWASDTNFRRNPGVCRRLEPNQVVYPVSSQPLASCNGLFRLVMDAEGRLSVIDPQNVPVFQSFTGGPGSISIMQRDGNLVVYDIDDVPRWATGTSTVPGAYAALEDDGTLAVLDPNDVKLWPPAP